MNIQLSEEQRLLRDSVLKLLADTHPSSRNLGRAPMQPQELARFWRQAAELGWLGLSVPAEAGGLGADWSDLLLIGEALGRHLVRSPFAHCIGFSGRAIAVGAREDRRTAHLSDIASGAAVAVPAVHEPPEPLNPMACRTVARKTAGGYAISGHKAAVSFGDTADLLLVSAAVDGEPGPSLFLVDAKAPGVRRQAYATMDGAGAADIHFDAVTVAAADRLAGNEDPFAAAIDTAALLAAAEMVGAMWTLETLTLDYLKTRKQFGATLGSFQALQHRMVDMYVACQTAESALLDAAATLDGEDAAVRAQRISRARLHIDRAARKVAQEAIQLHGGIGMTAEYPAGAYFKRIEVLRTSFGGETWHRARCRRLSRSQDLGS